MIRSGLDVDRLGMIARSLLNWKTTTLLAPFTLFRLELIACLIFTEAGLRTRVDDRLLTGSYALKTVIRILRLSVPEKYHLHTGPRNRSFV